MLARPRSAHQVWYRSEIEYGPFEREVSLYVHESARTGRITGATPTPFSTPRAPPPTRTKCTSDDDDCH